MRSLSNETPRIARWKHRKKMNCHIIATVKVSQVISLTKRPVESHFSVDKDTFRIYLTLNK